MSLTFGMLSKSLDKQGLSPNPTPLLATLPSGDVNAQIHIEPKTKVPIIFFEQGLFQFVYDFVMVVGWTMPTLSQQQLVDNSTLMRLSPNVHIPLQSAQFFYDLIFAYVANGNASTNTSYLSRPSHNLFITMLLLEDIELFFMAHEIAHLTRGHLSSDPSWRQEYEADEDALSLVSRRAFDSRGNWALAAWACDVVLHLLHLVGLAAATLEHGENALSWISKTHPSPDRTPT